MPFRRSLNVIINENLTGYTGIVNGLGNCETIAFLEVEINIEPSLDELERPDFGRPNKESTLPMPKLVALDLTEARRRAAGY